MVIVNSIRIERPRIYARIPDTGRTGPGEGLRATGVRTTDIQDVVAVDATARGFPVAFQRLYRDAVTLDVFFSYDSDDRLLVGRLKDGIENRSDQDVDIYIYEEDRRLGEPIAEKAKNRIRQADLFIVLITPNSKDSMWVHQEIGFAEGVDCPVVPIVHEDIDLLEIRGLLSGVEYLSLDPRQPDDFFREFLEYIERTFQASPAEEHKRRGDSLRADAEEHHEGSNFDRAIERYEEALEAYETARGLAAQDDRMDVEEIQGIIDDLEVDLRAARQNRLRDQLESLRSRVDQAEALLEENAVDDAEQEFEQLRSRLAAIETPIEERGFDDLRADLASLRARCEDRLEELQGDGDGENGGGETSTIRAIIRRLSSILGAPTARSRVSVFVDTLTDVDGLDARTAALIVVLAGLVAAVEATLPGVSITSVGVSEAVIYTVAFLFGGVVSGLAVGIGFTAFFLIFTLVGGLGLIWGGVKGIQAFVVGQVAGETTRSKAIAVAAGLPVSIVGFSIVPVADGAFLSLYNAAIGFVFALPLTWLLRRYVPWLQ